MKRYFVLFALLTMLLLLSVSALAQDDATAVPTDEISAETAEPTVLATAVPETTNTPEPEATATAIVIDINVDVTDGTGDTGDTGDTGGDGGTTGNTGNSVRDSVITIVMSILALVLGGGTVMLMAGNFRKDKAGVAATEKLGDSVPKEVALALVNLLRSGVAGAEIAIEALDGKPAAEKPPAIHNFTNEELIAEVQRRGYSITAG